MPTDPLTREMYGLINSVRTDLMAELRRVSAEFKADLRQHDLEHVRDREARSNRIRWAVTTIVSALGIMAAIIVAILGAWMSP